MDLQRAENRTLTPKYSSAPPQALSNESLAYFYGLLSDTGYDPEEFLKLARPLASEEEYQEIRLLAGVESAPDFSICCTNLPDFERWMLIVARDDDDSGGLFYRVADQLKITGDCCLETILN